MENSVLEEKVFHKVMKNIPFGLVVSSEGRKRKVYYVNTMAYHMLGYTREEFIEKVHGSLTHWNPKKYHKALK